MLSAKWRRRVFSSLQAARPRPRQNRVRWSQPLRRLSVGNKLLLIYLLDLITVVFISSVLIHEKYIAIDFSRKELQGTAYIDAMRPTMIALVDVSPTFRPSDATITALADIEHQVGESMQSGALSARFIEALRSQGDARDGATIEARRIASLQAGGELITRIGNQSNLILDPDLDSYYTMSLILLRYPALLNVVSEVTPRLRQSNGGMGVLDADRPACMS